MPFATADLSDAHGAKVAIAAPIFRDFGAINTFRGPIVTLRTFEDNAKVRTLLEGPGQGRVLVVDGGGSLGCALVGGNLAALAEANGWAGLLVHGAVRDVAELARANVGIKALAAVPRKSRKGDGGVVGEPVTFAGVTFAPGAFLYADGDGVLVSPIALD